NREATVLAKLSHPNIIGFWESFSHGFSRDIICIVMVYADGGEPSLVPPGPQRTPSRGGDGPRLVLPDDACAQTYPRPQDSASR
ncbi:unnamed protein product, partial [Ascophyllum nodosum]